ncbi:MAG: N-acetylmuramoyl-L-alanine amidase [Clostridia bacterium]
MMVIDKKRIKIILGCILIAIFTFTFQVANQKENANKIQEQTAQTTSTPVSGKTVVLDAGHGVPDEGAQSSNGITEAETNLKITLKIQKLLEQSGCTVILTRSDENAIYDLDATTLKQKKISDIHNRVKIGNENSADIFVSIHLNKIPQSQYSGWQCFYKDGNENSNKLAKTIQENLNKSMQKENKRVPMKLDNVYIIKHVEIPISIVECGFLSNPEEEKELLEDSYQNKLAWGIYNGIINYFY